MRRATITLILLIVLHIFSISIFDSVGVKAQNACEPMRDDLNFTEVRQLGYGMDVDDSTLAWDENDVIWINRYSGMWLFDHELQPIERSLHQDWSGLGNFLSWGLGNRYVALNAALSNENKRLGIYDRAHDTFTIMEDNESWPGFIGELVWNNDGLISSYFGATISIWDIATGQFLMSIEEDATISSLAWNSHGNLLAVSSIVGDIYIYDVTASKKVVNFTFGEENITSLVWHPEKPYLVGINRTGTLFTLDYHPEATVNDIRILASGLGSTGWNLEWSPDGNMLALYGKGLYLFPEKNLTETRLPAEKKYGHEFDAPIADIAWSPDSNQLVAMTRAGILSIWEMTDTFERIYEFDGGHTGQIKETIWDYSGDFLITSGSDGTVRLWKEPLDTFAEILLTTDMPIQYVDLNTAGNQLAVSTNPSGTDGIQIWSLSNRHLTQTLSPQQTFAPFDWHPTSDVLADIYYADGYAYVQTWDPITGKIYGTSEALVSETGRIEVFKWNPQGTRIFVGGWVVTEYDGAVGIMNIVEVADDYSITDTENILINYTGMDVFFGENPRAADWHPDGNQLVVAENDEGIHQIVVWDIDRYDKLLEIPVDGWLTDVDYSPDGAFILATDNTNNRILVFNATSGEQVTEWHVYQPISLAWNPCHPMIVIGDDTGILHIFQKPSQLHER